MSGDETVAHKALLWPKDVAVALSAKGADKSTKLLHGVQAAVPLIGGFIAQQVFARGANTRAKVLTFYAGAGVANVMADWIAVQLMKRELRRAAGKAQTHDFDTQSQFDTMAGRAGPLSGSPLAPIIGYNSMPALPRYPFGTGSHYSRNQQLGWAQSRQLGFQAGL